MNIEKNLRTPFFQNTPMAVFVRILTWHCEYETIKLNKITKLQKVKQLQVQAIQMQSKIFLQQNQEYPLQNHTLATPVLSTDIAVRKMKVQGGYYNIGL